MELKIIERKDSQYLRLSSKIKRKIYYAERLIRPNINEISSKNLLLEYTLALSALESILIRLGKG